MLVADYPAAVAEVTAGELERIEAALRNPATAEFLEGYDVSPEGFAYPYMIELYQLVPLGEWARPWVLVLEEDGEREVIPCDSLRYAAGELAAGLDYLTEAYANAYGPEEDDSDDD